MILTSEAQARDWLASLPEADPVALGRLERLAELLRVENTRQNLVSAASLDHVWLRHIADSAQLLLHVPRGTQGPWLDLGTGAGFPGIVVAALRPDVPVIMVESRSRRVEWLSRVLDELGLAQARLIGSPLEQVASQPVGVISARAFAPLGRLLEVSARFSTADTTWLLPKGRSARDEVEELVGWSHMFHVEQSLTDAEAGVIVGRVAGPSPVLKSKRKR